MNCSKNLLIFLYDSCIRCCRWRRRCRRECKLHFFFVSLLYIPTKHWKKKEKQQQSICPRGIYTTALQCISNRWYGMLPLTSVFVILLCYSHYVVHHRQQHQPSESFKFKLNIHRRRRFMKVPKTKNEIGCSIPLSSN